MGWGEVGWGEVGWGRRLKLSSLRPAEALEWWAAMARVGAWRLVQDKRWPQLDASSQGGAAPLAPYRGRAALAYSLLQGLSLAAVLTLVEYISIRLRTQFQIL